MPRLAPLALLLPLLAGCAPDIVPVRVAGVLRVNDSAYSVTASEQVTVTFVSPSGLGAGGLVSFKDGSFEVKGPLEGGAIPAGTYRITVTTKPIPGREATAVDSEKFAEFQRENTPLTAEVAPDKPSRFIVDIGRKTITPIEPAP